MYERRLLSDCTLCPRDCHVDRSQGQTGYCGETDQLRVARAALHHWEEPCLSGERGSGTVFFSGCALGCVYCQNHLVARGLRGRVVTIPQLAEICLDLQTQGAHNVNLVTPSHFAPQIAAAIDLAKASGLQLPIVYNCGGYERLETLRLLAGRVDVYLPDLKYCSPAIAARYSNCPDYFQHALPAIAEMLRQVGEPVFAADGSLQRGVIVRHLLLPGNLSDSQQIVRHLYQAFGDRIYLSLMNQFTPLPPLAAYPEINRRVSEQEYEQLVQYAIAIGVENGFIQEGETASESFIPDFGEPGC